MASDHAVFASTVTPAAAPSKSINVPLVPYSSSFPSHLLRLVVTSDRSCSWWHPSSTAAASIQPSSASHGAAARLYIIGRPPFLEQAFRTTEESLRGAFERFGQLTEVNLVMDRVAKRSRGFAFLSYANEEESKDAMEGMHGKFLDGRVIFVQVCKAEGLNSEHAQVPKQNTKPIQIGISSG